MPEDDNPSPPTLAEAIAAGIDAQASRAEALASWQGLAEPDPRADALVELRERDPEAFEAMRPNRIALAIQTDGAKAAARAFRWDAGREFELGLRAEGATFTPEIEKRLDTYAAARNLAERHHLLEAARRAAAEKQGA